MSDIQPQRGPNEGRGKLAAILVILVLLAAGVWLVHLLGAASAVQDCVASGHRDCSQ